MKQHQLTSEEIKDVLEKADVGRIATHNDNGYPYIVPIHYIVLDDNVYIHGLTKGLKISNIQNNSKVGFEVDEMGEIIPDYTDPCDTNTTFRSVII